MVICGSLGWMLVAAAADNSPVGYWKTIDDVTGQPKSILQIKETSNHTLYGKVVKVFPQAGQDPNPVCKACEGEKHNQPIIGMTILENLTQSQDDPTLWTGGSILEPKTGKVYHCNIQVMDGGEKLNVKGYIGIPTFGRSQTWIRAGRSG
ncbi:MAG: DUF2147 domain-containing protein [Gammaproteobacteria bacterium]|nr:MAG: DUF2147 domain-containing protein [Gammaproteobacteria bacterium]